jgi:hypothetical protein
LTIFAIFLPDRANYKETFTISGGFVAFLHLNARAFLHNKLKGTAMLCPYEGGVCSGASSK